MSPAYKIICICLCFVLIVSSYTLTLKKPFVKELLHLQLLPTNIKHCYSWHKNYSHDINYVHTSIPLQSCKPEHSLTTKPRVLCFWPKYNNIMNSKDREIWLSRLKFKLYICMCYNNINNIIPLKVKDCTCFGWPCNLALAGVHSQHRYPWLLSKHQKLTLT